jgi:hypothetical protein
LFWFLNFLRTAKLTKRERKGVSYSLYSLEYADIPKAFFAPHDVNHCCALDHCYITIIRGYCCWLGRCCTYVIRGHCCFSVCSTNGLISRCYTSVCLSSQCSVWMNPAHAGRLPPRINSTDRHGWTREPYADSRSFLEKPFLVTWFQKMSVFLWKWKLCYRVKSNSVVHTLSTYLFKVCFNIIHSPICSFRKWSLSFRFYHAIGAPVYGVTRESVRKCGRDLRSESLRTAALTN